MVMGHILVRTVGPYLKQAEHIFVLDLLMNVDMPLFIFLSGYMAYKVTSACSLGQQYWRKAISLLLPFLITGGLYALLHEDFYGLFFDRYKKGYWFTFTLFEIFCLYYPLDFISKKWNQKKLWWVDLCIFGIAWIVLDGIRVTNMLPPSIRALIEPDKLMHFRFFVFGIFCRKYLVLNRLLHSSNMGFSLMLVLFSGLFVLLYKYHYGNYITFLLLGISGIWCLFYLVTHYSETIPFGRRLAFLGTRSLDIYVVHYFLLMDLSRITPPSPAIVDCQ